MNIRVSQARKRSLACLHLSTLRLAPHDALRMTRGQSGLLFLSCRRLSLFTLCRSPGALACFIFRFVHGPQLASQRFVSPLPGSMTAGSNKPLQFRHRRHQDPTASQLAE
jgi:hypothetical protein